MQSSVCMYTWRKLDSICDLFCWLKLNNLSQKKKDLLLKFDEMMKVSFAWIFSKLVPIGRYSLGKKNPCLVADQRIGPSFEKIWKLWTWKEEIFFGRFYEILWKSYTLDFDSCSQTHACGNLLQKNRKIVLVTIVCLLRWSNKITKINWVNILR